MDVLRRFWHRVEHLMGWNTGTSETFWALFRHGDEKRLMGAFRCACGELQHVHEVPEHVVYPEQHMERWR